MLVKDQTVNGGCDFDASVNNGHGGLSTVKHSTNMRRKAPNE